MGDAFTHEMGDDQPPRAQRRGQRLRRQLPQARDRRPAAADRQQRSWPPSIRPCQTRPAPLPRGRRRFAAVGCAGCHTPSMPGPGRTINLYSDLLVHDMGPALDDQFVAGSASGTQWRTAPLWRASERVTSCTTAARRPSATPSRRTAARRRPPPPRTRRSIRRRSRRCSRSSAASSRFVLVAGRQRSLRGRPAMSFVVKAVR